MRPSFIPLAGYSSLLAFFTARFRVAFFATGDIAGAREASAKAKFWALLSAALMLIPVLLYLLLLFALGMFGVLGGLGGVN